jgi:hypothetical protein
MEHIFAGYEQRFPWLKLSPIRKHMTTALRSIVAKTMTIRNVETELAALEGDRPTDKVTRLLTSLAKSSLYSDPTTAAEELAFVKKSEKARLTIRLNKAKLEKETLENDAMGDINRCLAAANIVQRPEQFLLNLLDTDAELITFWNDLIRDISTFYIVSFDLNKSKNQRAKDKKKADSEARKAKENEAIVVSKKQLEKMIKEGISKTSGKGRGVRFQPKANSGSRTKQGTGQKKKTTSKKKRQPSKRTGGKRRN